MQHSAWLLQGCNVLSRSVVQPYRGSALIAMEWLSHCSHLFMLHCCSASHSAEFDHLFEIKLLLQDMKYTYDQMIDEKLLYMIWYGHIVTTVFLSGQSQTQCTPVPLPALGTQRIIQGNGTNVGTVISLQCPAKHKLVGSELMCVMDTNSTHWVGETYCKREWDCM